MLSGGEDGGSPSQPTGGSRDNGEGRFVRPDRGPLPRPRPRRLQSRLRNVHEGIQEKLQSWFHVHGGIQEKLRWLQSL